MTNKRAPIAAWFRRMAGGVGIAVAIVSCTLYCGLFLVSAQAFLPRALRLVVAYPSRWLRHGIDVALGFVGAAPAGFELRSGLYLLVVCGLVPWLALAALRRGRPHDLGLRRPNRLGWRITLLGLIVAIPFLVWMVQGPRFAAPYLGHLERAGPLAFCSFYLVNMLSEHFFLHGVVLAACRRGLRWPAPPPVASPDRGGPTRALQWIGLAQPTSGAHGWRRVIRWAGLPDGCLWAILCSTLLFGLVHIGKDSREMLLSFPGGAVQAYLAYRTNTWLTPFALHLLTASAACAMIIAMR